MYGLNTTKGEADINNILMCRVSTAKEHIPGHSYCEMRSLKTYRKIIAVFGKRKEGYALISNVLGKIPGTNSKKIG